VEVVENINLVSDIEREIIRARTTKSIVCVCLEFI